MFAERTQGEFSEPPLEPVGLRHVDSVRCWCEPIVETDVDGAATVVHREITWN